MIWTKEDEPESDTAIHLSYSYKVSKTSVVPGGVMLLVRMGTQSTAWFW